jgi:hypothetical protein
VIGQVVAAVRPVRTGGHGHAWEAWEAWEVERVQISEWVGKDLSVVKIVDLLARRGVLAPYRTVHRFCTQRCGFGRGEGTTVRVADGEPGVECQIDFAKMGLVYDPGAGRRRVTHALIFTAVYSRHMFVWLRFSQTLAAVIEGCEAAWRFFGGVFGVLIPDNASAIVADAEAVNPRFTPRLAGLHPALRVRDRRREGPQLERQTPCGARCPICPRELLRRRGVPRPG